MLLFGLESGCNRILTLMKKGIDKQTIIEVCENSTQAGIWNHVFLFFGFPTENEEEAQETIDLVLSNKDIIHSVGCSFFSLNKYSPIREHPELYGVSNLQIDESRDFQISYDYDVNAGMDKEKAWEIYEAFQERLAEEYDNFKVWELHREHLLLYLSWYGIKNLLSIGKETSNKGEPTNLIQKERWSDMVPRLREGVTCSSVRFDLLEIQKNIKEEVDTEILPKETHIVFNFNEGKIVSITSSAKKILEFCDGKTSIYEIASKIAEVYSISVNDAETGCIDFLEGLVNRGLVLV